MVEAQRGSILACALLLFAHQAAAISSGAGIDGARVGASRPGRGRHGAVQLRQLVNASAGWEHLPDAPRLAIVTGGTPDVFGQENYGSKTLTLMREYARRQGYGLYVDRNLGRFSDRRKGWNKIKLMQELLSEVPVLAWIDADVVLRNLSIPLHELLESSRCDAVEQSKWEAYLPPRPSKDTFLWISADMTPNRYLVNVNTGVIVLRNTSLAQDFLQSVWKVGEEERHFEHHNDPWAWASSGQDSPEYGWPWEQGAVWDVLAANPDKYMRATCVAEIGALQSVRPYQWSAGQFAQHCSAMSGYARTKVARFALSRLEAGLE